MKKTSKTAGDRAIRWTKDKLFRIVYKKNGNWSKYNPHGTQIAARDGVGDELGISTVNSDFKMEKDPVAVAGKKRNEMLRDEPIGDGQRTAKDFDRTKECDY